MNDFCEAEPLREIEFKVREGLVAHADPVLMRLVLMNLLGNAWKYTVIRKHAHIELGEESSPEGRIYYVRDDGVGFDSPAAKELFVAFRRLCRPESVEGSGIGLAVVERAIARHGGKVWAEGIPDSGATFYFLLPIGESTTPPGISVVR